MIKRPIFSPRINIGQQGPPGGASGPASAVIDNFASFADTSGDNLKDSGISLSTSTTLSEDSDTIIPSQKAVKAYVDAIPVGSVTSSATPTINTDAVVAFSITALATDITSMTTNLSGTPDNFQKLMLRFKDNGTPRSITWGASFEAKGVDLPVITVASKVITVGLIYDTVTSKWGCVASVTEV